MEGFPKPVASSEEKDSQQSSQESVSPSTIEPIATELERRLADIDPVLTSEYSLPPEKAEDLNETLKDIGAK